MKLISSAITEEEAKLQGYKALTTPFDTELEPKELQRVMADMDRGNIDYVLVTDGKYGVAIWRKGMRSERDILSKEYHTPSAGRIGATTKRKDAFPR